MSKNIKRFYSLFMTIALLSSCNSINNPPELNGKFWSIEEAHLNGYLTKDHLETLSTFIKTNEPPPTFNPLTSEYEYAIKKTGATWFDLLCPEENFNNPEFIIIDKYYGQYEECHVVMIWHSQLGRPLPMIDEQYPIGGVDFRFFYRTSKPFVWRPI